LNIASINTLLGSNSRFSAIADGSPGPDHGLKPAGSPAVREGHS